MSYSLVKRPGSFSSFFSAKVKVSLGEKNNNRFEWDPQNVFGEKMLCLELTSTTIDERKAVETVYQSKIEMNRFVMRLNMSPKVKLSHSTRTSNLFCWNVSLLTQVAFSKKEDF